MVARSSSNCRILRLDSLPTPTTSCQSDPGLPHIAFHNSRVQCSQRPHRRPVLYHARDSHGGE